MLLSSHRPLCVFSRCEDFKLKFFCLTAPRTLLVTGKCWVKGGTWFWVGGFEIGWLLGFVQDSFFFSFLLWLDLSFSLVFLCCHLACDVRMKASRTCGCLQPAAWGRCSLLLLFLLFLLPFFPIFLKMLKSWVVRTYVFSSQFLLKFHHDYIVSLWNRHIVANVNLGNL